MFNAGAYMVEQETWMRSHLHVYDGHCEPCAERDSQRDHDTIRTQAARIAALERALRPLALWSESGHSCSVADEVAEAARRLIDAPNTASAGQPAEGDAE